MKLEQKAKEYIKKRLGFEDTRDTIECTVYSMAEFMSDFANSLTNLDEVKIDEEGNVLSEPEDYDSYMNVFNADRPMMHPWTNEDLDSFERYQQAQTISERLQSDKEKIKELIEINIDSLKDADKYRKEVKELEEAQVNSAHLSSSLTDSLDESKAEVDRLKEAISKIKVFFNDPIYKKMSDYKKCQYIEQLLKD
jgi:hypothetical protein